MTGIIPGRLPLARPAALYGAALIFCAEALATPIAERPESAGQTAVVVTIDAEHLIELYQYVSRLLIIDSRHVEDYLLGHIETSVNLPLASTNCKSLSKLANSMERAIVFYSNNSTGDTSIEAIRIASECGYKRLFWLRDGFVEWKSKDYPYVIE